MPQTVGRVGHPKGYSVRVTDVLNLTVGRACIDHSSVPTGMWAPVWVGRRRDCGASGGRRPLPTARGPAAPRMPRPMQHFPDSSARRPARDPRRECRDGLPPTDLAMPPAAPFEHAPPAHDGTNLSTHPISRRIWHGAAPARSRTAWHAQQRRPATPHQRRWHAMAEPPSRATLTPRTDDGATATLAQRDHPQAAAPGVT